METHSVDLEELTRTSLVADAKTDSLREALGEVGDDLYQKITVNSMRLARTTNDQPVATVLAGFSG